ncbi:hypothetical protein BCR32DRAFT_265718 [Anaeromyces robustus]|uniref:Origin recognition complex subunit 3 n=1 Tax=Anaeromyces robustus TaxID=1754192 RepID=A0A1Y1XHT4_9FUNG|nr:hypothetical protein BCR32DRAFT_265718 [Anaeromyces robustus]|eukprot:ORX85318.1 hypothetical protein BCR32DRAFT_265718 [Anaeromyces robustus]
MVANSTINITEAYDSLSEACFILWPSDKKKKNEFTKNDGFQSLMDKTETQDFINQRHNKYYKIWNNIKSQIDQLIFELNLSATNEIFNFVSSKLNKTYDNDNKESKLQLPFKEIPTGLIFSGINPDHKRIYNQIVLKLKTVPTNHVATLESKDCINLKNTMKIIIEQLMEKNMTEENEIIDTTEFYKKSKLKKNNKAPNYDPYILLGWYKHLIKDSSSSINIEDSLNEKDNSKLNIKKNSDNHKIILFIEDFECFDVLLLQDLISIFSGYSEELPIILLIGIATSLETFHQSLPISSLSLLQIEKFKLLQSYECINEIIEKIFIENVDFFKLGIKPYQYLLDNFNFLNLSVDSFIRGIKFSVMYHFYSNPLSILSSIDPTSEEINVIFNSLTKRHLDEAKVLTFNSFKTYINSIKSTSPQLVYKLLTDDNALKSFIKDGLINLHNYHIKFRVGFKCLLELQKLYHTPLFNKSKRTLYLLSLQESLFESSHVQLLIRRSKIVAYPAIKKFLKSIKTIVNEDEQAKQLLNCHIKVLDNILLKFEKLDDEGNEIKIEEKKKTKKGKEKIANKDEIKIKKEDDSDSKDIVEEEKEEEEVTEINKEKGNEDNEDEKEKEEIIINDNGKRLLNKKIYENSSLFDNVLKPYYPNSNIISFQRETKISKRLRAEELQGYETMIDEVNNFILNYFKETLKCYKEFPFHEIVYYTESSKLKKSFSAQPRSVIHTALNYPRYYLNCQCCSDNDHIIESSLHDTCIAYKLYLECGKLINLYDWFVAFGNILNDKIVKEKQKEKEINKRIKNKQKREAKEIEKEKYEKERKKEEKIDKNKKEKEQEEEEEEGKENKNNEHDVSFDSLLNENEDIIHKKGEDNSIIIIDVDNDKNVIKESLDKEEEENEEEDEEDEDDEDEDEDEDAFNEKEIQARFIRAISELQYFGFIKSTNRKVDHVIKLTWGSD